MEYKESENLELKSTVGEWKEIIVCLSAFANKSGGKIVVGLDDKGEPVGMEVGKSTLEDLANKIKNHTDPVLYPSINVKSFGPGEIIEIEVAESDNKPVFAFDRAYIRVGKTNQKITNSELRNLIKRYSLPDWDHQFMEVDFEKEINHDLVIKIAKTYFGKRIKNRNDEIAFLNSQGLSQKNKINNACYLLFANTLNKIPEAKIKAARFYGNQMSEFLDVKDFGINIIENIPEVM